MIGKKDYAGIKKIYATNFYQEDDKQIDRANTLIDNGKNVLWDNVSFNDKASPGDNGILFVDVPLKIKDTNCISAEYLEFSFQNYWGTEKILDFEIQIIYKPGNQPVALN